MHTSELILCRKSQLLEKPASCCSILQPRRAQSMHVGTIPTQGLESTLCKHRPWAGCSFCWKLEKEFYTRSGSSEGLTSLSRRHPSGASLTIFTFCAASGNAQGYEWAHGLSEAWLSWLWLASRLLPNTILLVPEILIKANNLSKVIPAALSKGLQNWFFKQRTERLSLRCLCASRRRWGSLPILQPSVILTELFSWTNWVNYLLHRWCCGLSLVCLFSPFLFFTPLII